MLIELTIGLPCTHFRPASITAPLGLVDHDRHAGDVGLGGDQVEEGGHGLLGVEQALVHVDVDDLRAVLHLAARDGQRRRVVARLDQLAEFGRAGDVGPLADVDEGGCALVVVIALSHPTNVMAGCPDHPSLNTLRRPLLVGPRDKREDDIGESLRSHNHHPCSNGSRPARRILRSILGGLRGGTFAACAAIGDVLRAWSRSSRRGC